MDQEEWLGSTVNYEGHPMLLRVRPGAGRSAARPVLVLLAAITHRLAQVRADGLPEAGYNDGLADLDDAIIASLDAGGAGITVVVETVAGERTYYAYVTAPIHAQVALESVCIRFPEHHLSLATRRDESWQLYDEYKRLFPW